MFALESSVSFPFQSINEGFPAQTQCSPFPFEEVALSPFLDFVYLSTMTFRREMTQHLAQVSLCLYNPCRAQISLCL